MPNWCSNRLRVRGDREKIDALIMDCFEDYNFSLDKAIPMPESLDLEEGSTTNDGIVMYLYELKDETKAKEIAENLASKSFFRKADDYLIDDKRYNQLKRNYKGNLRNLRKVGKQAINNLLTYGFITWYGWRLANWGTKWDVSDNSKLYKHSVDDTKVEIVQYFDSPWGPPSEGIATVVKNHPGLEFELLAYEPGMDFYSIETNFKDALSEDEINEKMKKAKEIHESKQSDDENEDCYGNCDAFIDAVGFYDYAK